MRSYVIGGGSRGLGRAVADELVRRGDRVLLVARNEDSLAEAVAALGERALSVAADLGSAEGAEVVARAVDEQLGGSIDGALVNQGGPPAGNMLELTDEQWHTAFELCIAGPIRLVRALTPTFSRRRVGRVRRLVVHAPARSPGSTRRTSCARASPRSSARWRERSAPAVRVNAVSPGRFDTERGEIVLVARAEARGVSVEEEARPRWPPLVPARALRRNRRVRARVRLSPLAGGVLRHGGEPRRGRRARRFAT